MTAGGGKGYTRPPRAKFGPAPTRPVSPESNACNALASPAQLLLRCKDLFSAGFSPETGADGGRGDVDGAVIGLSDCLVKRTMGSDAWRGWYQGIGVSTQGTSTYLHPCLVSGMLVMCIHLSART